MQFLLNLYKKLHSIQWQNRAKPKPKSFRIGSEKTLSGFDYTHPTGLRNTLLCLLLGIGIKALIAIA